MVSNGVYNLNFEFGGMMEVVEFEAYGYHLFVLNFYLSKKKKNVFVLNFWLVLLVPRGQGGMGNQKQREYLATLIWMLDTT